MSSSAALSSAQQQPPTAADVSFTKLNTEHHADSNSPAESKSVTGKRSSLSDKLRREKGKRRSALADAPENDDDKSNGGTPARSKKSGGFLLDSIFANGRVRTPDSGHRNSSQDIPDRRKGAEKRVFTDPRFSGDSSQRSWPLSHDDPNQTDPQARQNVQQPAMDPAQLVRMALNLSESRKRHVSGSLPVPISPAGVRRVVSVVDAGNDNVLSSASGGKGANYLHDSLGRRSPVSTRTDRQDRDEAGYTTVGDNVIYTFTPATLSRAEKARRYFELASEHRRLLEHLPPLRPDASAPGNYLLHSTSSPGTAHYDMTRVPSQNKISRPLGRAYNPLQALRNRRTRNRERRPLTAPADTWLETDKIKRWVDGVATVSQDPSYRPGNDLVRLPRFSGELEAGHARPETAKGHRRSDTVNSVITRPENGWTVEPAELLADTYWMEQDDNKTVIEDQHGSRLFQPRPRFSAELPRLSRDSLRGHDADLDYQSQYGESDEEERSKARRRNMFPIPHRLRRNPISRSGSVTSNSSDEGRKPPRLQFDSAEGGDENIGPLERHMRMMIAKDENGELPSPELLSPDHWDSKHTPFPNARTDPDQSHGNSVQTSNGRLSVDMGRHKRSRSAEGRLASTGNGMSSMDEIGSSSPTSPVVPGYAAMDGSTTEGHRQSSIDQKRKRHHLPGFRSHSKERNNIDYTDFATKVGPPLSPVTSAESTKQSRASAEFHRPVQFTRQRTGESTTSSLQRLNTAESSTKDGGSRRFFKGRRIGDLVRGEGARLGDRIRGTRERLGDTGLASDMSRVQTDVESDAESQTNDKPRARKDDFVGTDSEISPRASLDRERPRSKYFTSNLPSFKSPGGRNNRSSIIQTPMSDASDPFAKVGNTQHQENDRYSRFIPPRISLPHDIDESADQNPDRALSSEVLDADGYHSLRTSGSYDRLSPIPSNTTVSLPKRKDGMPVTGLSKQDSKRHWSISDQGSIGQAKRVTPQDIARVRALLLTSGIKAHEIYNKADSVRESPLPLLTKAAETAGQTLENIPRKQENLAAARMLSNTLHTAISDYETSIQRFQTDTAKQLSTDLERLSHRASEQLTNIVDETSDDADAFNVEITTKQPQEVKRVLDAVDDLLRRRHRQFRLVVGAGFKLLEWLLLGIMWWVWFLVVLFNTGRKIVVGILRILRWLLWF